MTLKKKASETSAGFLTLSRHRNASTNTEVALSFSQSQRRRHRKVACHWVKVFNLPRCPINNNSGHVGVRSVRHAAQHAAAQPRQVPAAACRSTAYSGPALLVWPRRGFRISMPTVKRLKSGSCTSGTHRAGRRSTRAGWCPCWSSTACGECWM